MASENPLIFDVDSEAFIRSLAEPSVISPPAWYADDIKPLRFQFVNRTSATQVTVRSGAGISLRIAVGDPAPTPVVDASATAGSPDASHIFPVTLGLNVAAVQTALGSADTVTRILEFRWSDGTNPQRWETPIRLKQRIITDALADVPAPAVAISSVEAQSLFVPRDGSNASYPLSYFIVLDEEDSTKKYKVSLRAGEWHVEPLQ